MISAPNHRQLRAGLVDADVHVEVPGLDALRPYLPAHWLEYVELSRYRGPAVGYHPPALLGASGISDLPELRSRLLDREPLAIAILNCCSAVDSIRDHELAAAMAAATNDWLATEWLSGDERVRGSLVVPVQAPDIAAAEIDRWAGDRRFVQVLLPVRSLQPYGARVYGPLFQAAVKAGLVVGLHFGGASANPTSPVGWPTLFIEEYVAMAGAFATQLTSLVADGALARHPDLRLTLIESGVSWLPGHLWRADMYWRAMRRLIPWVRRAPSAQIRKQVRLTIAPFDAPPDPAGVAAVINQLGSDELLLYASGHPIRAELGGLLEALSAETAARVRRQNAVEWYRLQEPAA